MSSFGFRKYACNPRAITEYLLTNHSDEYEIYWAFEKGFVPKNMDKRSNIPTTLNALCKSYFNNFFNI